MSEDELGEKLVRMESIIAHLEHQYEELNKVVMEQGKVLSKALSQQERIADTLREMRQDEIRGDDRDDRDADAKDVGRGETRHRRRQASVSDQD